MRSWLATVCWPKPGSWPFFDQKMGCCFEAFFLWQKKCLKKNVSNLWCCKKWKIICPTSASEVLPSGCPVTVKNLIYCCRLLLRVNPATLTTCSAIGRRPPELAGTGGQLLIDYWRQCDKKVLRNGKLKSAMPGGIIKIRATFKIVLIS